MHSVKHKFNWWQKVWQHNICFIIPFNNLPIKIFFIYSFRWLFFNHLLKKVMKNAQMKTLSEEESGGWELFSPAVAWTLLNNSGASNLSSAPCFNMSKWSLYQSKVKPRAGELRKAVAVQLKTYRHSKLQNLQSHLFRFSLQMWRDAKKKWRGKNRKTGKMTTWINTVHSLASEDMIKHFVCVCANAVR